MRRVLKPGGRFIFSVWDRISENEFSDIVNNTLKKLFPADPPNFLARTPYGYYDRSAIEQDLRSGGFHKPALIETVAFRSRAQSASEPAIAFCQGTPLCNEIESRAPARLSEVTSRVAEAIAGRCGPGPIDGKIQANVVSLDS